MLLKRRPTKQGRQRDLEVEAKVLSLLADGLAIGKVAVLAGIHRNSVRNIRNRVREVTDPACNADDVLQQGKVLEQLKREQEEIARREQAAKARMKLIKYRCAVEKLIALIEKAADAVTKAHSVWSAVYLDKPLANEGSLHDLIGGAADDPSESVERAELSEILNSSLAKLDEFQQRVLRLVFWEGKSPKEIAVQLGVDESQVAKIQAEGLGLLGDSLK